MDISQKHPVKIMGICYRCMFGEHKHCFGQDGSCVCCRHSHKLEWVMTEINKRLVSIGADPLPFPPPRLPEEPADHEKYYFRANVYPKQDTMPHVGSTN